jgi:hypothetical protein
MVKVECENRQRKFCIVQTNCKHFQGGYKRLQLGDVYTCHGFFEGTYKLKKPIPKHFFITLLNNLFVKDLVTIGNLLST